MRVGIYQDLRDPPAWKRGWTTVYGSSLERAEQAERLGLDSVWCSEHHFFEDGYLPQPLTWAAAVAARTRKVTVGTAIMIAPLHKPLEIAEQAAVVDQISGGRLQLGLGAGYVEREFRAFGVDPGRRFLTTERHAIEVKRLLDEKIVTPSAVQERVPIWFGGFGPRGARFAGRQGFGLLWLDEATLPIYRQGLVEGGRSPDAAIMGGMATLVISRDPDRAWSQMAPYLQYQRTSYVEAAMAHGGESGAGIVQASEGDEDPNKYRSDGPQMLPPGFDAVTPEEAVRRLRTWLQKMPVSDIYFWDSVAGMPDELVDEHLNLLATEVRPHLQEMPTGAPEMDDLRAAP